MKPKIVKGNDYEEIETGEVVRLISTFATLDSLSTDKGKKAGGQYFLAFYTTRNGEERIMSHETFEKRFVENIPF